MEAGGRSVLSMSSAPARRGIRPIILPTATITFGLWTLAAVSGPVTARFDGGVLTMNGVAIRQGPPEYWVIKTAGDGAFEASLKLSQSATSHNCQIDIDPDSEAVAARVLCVRSGPTPSIDATYVVFNSVGGRGYVVMDPRGSVETLLKPIPEPSGGADVAGPHAGGRWNIVKAMNYDPDLALPGSPLKVLLHAVVGDKLWLTTATIFRPTQGSPNPLFVWEELPLAVPTTSEASGVSLDRFDMMSVSTDDFSVIIAAPPVAGAALRMVTVSHATAVHGALADAVTSSIRPGIAGVTQTPVGASVGIGMPQLQVLERDEETGQVRTSRLELGVGQQAGPTGAANACQDGVTDWGSATPTAGAFAGYGERFSFQDVNGDGFTDLLAVSDAPSRGNGWPTLFAGDGSGCFLAGQPLPAETNAAWAPVTGGDVGATGLWPFTDQPTPVLGGPSTGVAQAGPGKVYVQDL